MTSSATFAREALFDCTGLVAVVTGAGSGIGLVIARALAQNGATVYILGRRLAKLQEAVAGFTAPAGGAGKLVALQCDATSKDALKAAAESIAASAGYINLLVVNHGILGPQHAPLMARPADDPRGPLRLAEAQENLWNTPLEEVVDVYRTNVASVLFTAVAFLALLDKGNSKGNVKQTSQVIITSSIGGFHRSWQQGGIAYSTSKASVNHLIKCLASFLIQWRIRVNGIAPGIFPSEMTDKFLGDRDIPQDGAIPTTMQPMGRSGREEEMAGTVTYFASPAGSYLAGTIHVIDGGRLGSQPGSTY